MLIYGYIFLKNNNISWSTEKSNIFKTIYVVSLFNQPNLLVVISCWRPNCVSYPPIWPSLSLVNGHIRLSSNQLWTLKASLACTKKGSLYFHTSLRVLLPSIFIIIFILFIYWSKTRTFYYSVIWNKQQLIHGERLKTKLRTCNTLSLIKAWPIWFSLLIYEHDELNIFYTMKQRNTISLQIFFSLTFVLIIFKFIFLYLINWWWQVMFSNRKERGELLEGLIVSNKDDTTTDFPQVYM